MKVKTFRDLLVWQKAMDLVTGIYEATASFPKEEVYGLTSQMRRAAISVPSNIAEGSSRKSTQEFIRFSNIANASLMELETQILIANRLKMLSNEITESLIKSAEEISRMTNALRKSLYNKLKETT